MAKPNCWEFMKCGREYGGPKETEFGVCPAFTEARVDGIHGGKNGGRCCWAVAGTFCLGKIQGSYAEKMGSCIDCSFYMKVKDEEKNEFMKASEIKAAIMKS